MAHERKDAFRDDARSKQAHKAMIERLDEDDKRRLEEEKEEIHLKQLDKDINAYYLEKRRRAKERRAEEERAKERRAALKRQRELSFQKERIAQYTEYNRKKRHKKDQHKAALAMVLLSKTSPQLRL